MARRPINRRGPGRSPSAARATRALQTGRRPVSSLLARRPGAAQALRRGVRGGAGPARAGGGNPAGTGLGTSAAAIRETNRIRAGSQVGGGQQTVAESAGLRDQFSEALGQALQGREVKGPDVESQLGRAAEELTGQQGAASLALQRGAAATGFGRSGGLQAGQQALSEQFAGIGATTAREIREGGEEQRSRDQAREDTRLLQALGVASGAIANEDRLALAERDFENRIRLANIGRNPRNPRNQRGGGQQDALARARGIALQAGGSTGGGGRGSATRLTGGGLLSAFGSGSGLTTSDPGQKGPGVTFFDTPLDTGLSQLSGRPIRQPPPAIRGTRAI